MSCFGPCHYVHPTVELSREVRRTSSAGANGYAFILPSLSELPGYVDPEGALAIIPGVAKCQRELAVPCVIFVAFEIMFQANILCFAEAFKPGIGTPKPFGALHLPNDFVDLLSSIFVHELLFSMHNNVNMVPVHRAVHRGQNTNSYDRS